MVDLVTIVIWFAGAVLFWRLLRNVTSEVPSFIVYAIAICWPVAMPLLIIYIVTIICVDAAQRKFFP